MAPINEINWFDATMEQNLGENQLLTLVYFSASTISLTGLGDIYPLSNAERILTTILMIVSLILFIKMTKKMQEIIIQTLVTHDPFSEENTNLN